MSGTLSRNRHNRFELKDIVDSDYLCLFCFDPIYINVKTKKGSNFIGF